MTPLSVFAAITILFAIAAIAWRLFESRWDQKLFTKSDTIHSENLSVAQTIALLDSPSPPTILDVRSRREFDRGHLPNSRHLCSSDPDFADRLGSLDVTKPHLIYCAGGYRSRQVCGLMKKLGFRKIYNLHRGLLSWRLRGKPVER